MADRLLDLYKFQSYLKYGDEDNKTGMGDGLGNGFTLRQNSERRASDFRETENISTLIAKANDSREETIQKLTQTIFQPNIGTADKNKPTNQPDSLDFYTAQVKRAREVNPYQSLAYSRAINPVRDFKSKQLSH